MAIKLVLCDMDGTLVPFGSRGVSTRTINSIHALMDAGIHFGPSSGRALCDLVSFFSGDEACINTGILANGKLVFVDGELVYRRPIPRVALSELVEALYGIHDAVFTSICQLMNTVEGQLALERLVRRHRSLPPCRPPLASRSQGDFIRSSPMGTSLREPYW